MLSITSQIILDVFSTIMDLWMAQKYFARIMFTEGKYMAIFRCSKYDRFLRLDLAKFVGENLRQQAKILSLLLDEKIFKIKIYIYFLHFVGENRSSMKISRR